MSFKAIVFFALLAVVFAEKPYLGFRMPQLLLGDPQVVGGEEAPEGSHPYIVSLQWGTSSFTQHFCAGSILENEWILTAAHCILAVPPSGTFLIKAGKHNININEDNEQVIEVQRSIVHEQYKGGVGPYDIALIKLKTPLKYTKEVQPIKLPPAESEPTGDALLCGWGSTSRSSIPNMPHKLQHVEKEYVNRQLCYESVLRLTGSSPVHETNVCTGPLTGGISACSGDSGGPLVSGNKAVITGIVSWGIIPCGTTGAPSVYTKVSKFNNWIAQKMASY